MAKKRGRPRKTTLTASKPAVKKTAARRGRPPTVQKKREKEKKQRRELLSNIDVGTKAGQAAFLVAELEKCERVLDRIRILKEIASLRGLNLQHNIGDIKYLPQEELEDLFAEVVFPVVHSLDPDAFSEILAAAISRGRRIPLDDSGDLPRMDEEEDSSWRAVRSGRQSDGPAEAVPPEHRKDKITLRWKPEWQVPGSFARDQVVAGGFAPVPDDALTAEDIRNLRRLPHAV